MTERKKLNISLYGKNKVIFKVTKNLVKPLNFEEPLFVEYQQSQKITPPMLRSMQHSCLFLLFMHFKENKKLYFEYS